MSKTKATKLQADEAFVRQWCNAYKEGLTLSELAERRGESRHKLHNTIRRLRFIGVRLPLLVGQDRFKPLADRLNKVIVACGVETSQ